MQANKRKANTGIPIEERFLHGIDDQLQTADGKSVRIMSTLTNHETAPNPFLVDGDGILHTTSLLRVWRLT
jgi:hypothetical protein